MGLHEEQGETGTWHQDTAVPQFTPCGTHPPTLWGAPGCICPTTCTHTPSPAGGGACGAGVPCASHRDIDGDRPRITHAPIRDCPAQGHPHVLGTPTGHGAAPAGCGAEAGPSGAGLERCVLPAHSCLSHCWILPGRDRAHSPTAAPLHPTAGLTRPPLSSYTCVCPNPPSPHHGITHSVGKDR